MLMNFCNFGASILQIFLWVSQEQIKSEGQLVVAGTKGYILAESPWWLTRYFEVRYEDPMKKERYFSNFLGDGLRYEISDFAYMIQGHRGRAFKFTAEESVAIAGVMERFFLQRKGNNSC